MKTVSRASTICVLNGEGFSFIPAKASLRALRDSRDKPWSATKYNRNGNPIADPSEEYIVPVGLLRKVSLALALDVQLKLCVDLIGI